MDSNCLTDTNDNENKQIIKWTPKFCYLKPYNEELKKYINYYENIDTEKDTGKLIIKVSKIHRHIINNNLFFRFKYNSLFKMYGEKNKPESYFFGMNCYSYTSPKKYFTIPISGDVLVGFKLSKYDIGDDFEVLVHGSLITKYTITKENKNKLFMPVENMFPIPIVAFNNHHYNVVLQRKNGTLDKPIRTYYSLFENDLRKRIANSENIMISETKIYKVREDMFSYRHKS